MGKLLESDDYFIINVILLFLLINFNLQIGQIYIAMAVIDWVAYYIARDLNLFKFLPIEKNRNQRYQNLVWAMGAYVAFIFISNFAVTRFAVAPTDLSLFENVNALIIETFSATPILAGSTYLKILVWGLLIPIVETRFFFRTLLQWVMKKADVNQNIKFLSLPGQWISAVFGAAFSIFHIVAKGITNNTSLFVTFIFGYVSVGLVLHYREVIQALFLHIITNTIATMQQQGIQLFNAAGLNTQGVLMLGGMILASWLLLFNEIPLIDKKGLSLKNFFPS